MCFLLIGFTINKRDHGLAGGVLNSNPEAANICGIAAWRSQDPMPQMFLLATLAF